MGNSEHDAPHLEPTSTTRLKPREADPEIETISGEVVEEWSRQQRPERLIQDEQERNHRSWNPIGNALKLFAACAVTAATVWYGIYATNSGQTFASNNDIVAMGVNATPDWLDGFLPFTRNAADFIPAERDWLTTQQYRLCDNSMATAKYRFHAYACLKTASDERNGWRVVFFYDGKFFGNDASHASRRLHLAQRTGSVITVNYDRFQCDATGCHATGGSTTARFELRPHGQCPPEAQTGWCASASDLPDFAITGQAGR